MCHIESILFSFFVSVRDEAQYQLTDSVGTIMNGHGDIKTHGTLNTVTSFEVRQGVLLANALLEPNVNLSTINRDLYRQQFDSVSKDFLSVEQFRVDPLNGSFYQCLKDASDSAQFHNLYPFAIELKWWQLFGKYWLVKNDHNDDDIKKMKWLMTGGNHATVDMCGENYAMHCDSMYLNMNTVYRSMTK